MVMLRLTPQLSTLTVRAVSATASALASDVRPERKERL